MKKFGLFVVALGVVGASNALATDRKQVQYGDLYDVKWCPCDSEEQYDANGSVVLGKTVMCPCDSLYSGYDKGFKEDVKDFKEATAKKLRVVNYFKYYLGFDYVASSPSGGSEPLVFDDLILNTPISVLPDNILDDQNSLSFVLGARINKHFGFEAFYQSTYEDTVKSELDNKSLEAQNHYLMNEYTLSYKAYGVDLNGYIPLSTYFDVVGSLGVAQYKFENQANFAYYELNSNNFKGVVSKEFSEDKIGWRAGLGAQVNIADGIALRAMYRYVSIGGDLVDDISEYTLGVRFLF